MPQHYMKVWLCGEICWGDNSFVHDCHPCVLLICAENCGWISL